MRVFSITELLERHVPPGKVGQSIQSVVRRDNASEMPPTYFPCSTPAAFVFNVSLSLSLLYPCLSGCCCCRENQAIICSTYGNRASLGSPSYHIKINTTLPIVILQCDIILLILQVVRISFSIFFYTRFLCSFTDTFSKL